MRDSVDAVDQHHSRPPTSFPYNPNNFAPPFAPAFVHTPIPYSYPHQHPYSPNQTFTHPPYPTEELDMERKYSGTLGSTYDYRSQLLYPNSEPFRKDLDRKLTTIQHEEFNEQHSRIIVRSSLPTQDPLPQQAPDQPICFNICCILILLIGLVSLSLCVYLVLINQEEKDSSPISIPNYAMENPYNHMLVRRFNI